MFWTEKKEIKVVFNSMVLYHFVDPDTRVAIFGKEEAIKNGGTDCEMRI